VKMWSGRFRQPLDPEFERWQRSFPFDQCLLPYELEASRAHAHALEQVGILSSEELSDIERGLVEIGKKAESVPSFLADDEAEDVHHFVEKQLVALIGDTGYKLHGGRSRNEQIATDLRLYVRTTIDQIQGCLADWLSALLARAEKAGDAAMPAYTHTQPAEPVLVSHWLLAYVEMFLRDSERLTDCRVRLNLCPLGSGAVAGATVALDRGAIAADLGFDASTANSLDATSDRDFALEFVQVLSILALHLSRWAEEMILFSTQEYGFVSLPEPFSTGSSAMPQKKNADLLELARAKAARVLGASTTLLVTVKGLPLAYSKDMQETQEPVFDSARTVTSLLPLVTGWMKQVEFDFSRMQQVAQSGFMNAWAAATYLVERGVPSRLAHEAVGHAVKLAIERGCELQDLPLADLRSIHAAFEESVYQALTLDAVLKIHNVEGGTASEQVKRALQRAEHRISLLRGDVHAHA